MHEIGTLFGEISLLALLGVIVSLLLKRIRLPPVAGLLMVGALAGPHGFSLVGGHGRIELLAEVGVVLLLFTIGLEFSMARLRSIAHLVLLGGTLQVGLTTLATLGIMMALGADLPRALLVGFVFALSSTAVVLRALGERQETSAPHGQFIVGVLIFQDLIVVAMLLVVRALGDAGAAGSVGLENVGLQIGIALGKAAALVTGALLLAKYVLPAALARVEASRSREVLGLALFATCLGTAWLSSHLGLSLALGAFLGGLVIADSDYAHRAMADVIPVRDVLTSLFFVSMGMLFNARVVVEQPGWVLGLLAGFVLGKGLIASLAAMAMRFPARVAWLAGAALAQFGEFGFVLATEGERAGLTTKQELEPIFAAGLISMFITRVVITLAPRFAAGEVLLRPLERLLRARGIDETSEDHAGLAGHVVIVGYGPGGRVLSRRLAELGVTYLVLELNAQTVRTERARGVPIYYGDITSHEACHHAGVPSAAAVVLQISDDQAASRAVSAIRAEGIGVPIFIRTRRLLDAEQLRKLGADHIVCEEETASALLTEDVLALLQGRPSVLEARP